MKRNASKRKLSRPAAAVLLCLEVAVYAFSVLYGFLPASMGGGDPGLGSFLIFPGTIIGVHLAVKVWRLFGPAMARMKPHIVLRNLPRFARNTLCAALFYMPMLFSIDATTSPRMSLPVMAGVILVISACWTFIVFLCDLFLFIIHYDPKGQRQGPPPRGLGYAIRLRDAVKGSSMPLYFVVGGLYAALLAAEISATLSGVEPPNIQIILSILIYITFSVLIYRALFRLASKAFTKNPILGALMHLLRAFLCGMIIMAAALASDRRIGDLGHNTDYLFQNIRGGLFLGAVMELLALLIRRKYETAPSAVPQTPPEKPRALSRNEWFAHLNAQSKALEREALAHSKASVPPPAASPASPPEASKAAPVGNASSDGAPETAPQEVPKDVQAEPEPEEQSWAAADRWWIDEAPAPEPEPDRSKGASPEAARRPVRPEEVSRGQLLKWLALTEETLQPQGEALGTLAGQRALFEEAETLLPVLSTLRALPPLAQFLFEGDTEAAELPERVGALLGGIVDAIRQADLEIANIYWLELSPEALVHGWRALSVYRRISTAQATFDEVLTLLEAHLLEREEALNWLCWQCEGVDA